MCSSISKPLRPLCEEFAYVSLSLAGRERPALLVRAAHTEAPDLHLLTRIDHLLGLNDGPVMAYDDPRRSIGKRVKIEKAVSPPCAWPAKPWPATGCKACGWKAGPTSNCGAGCWRH